MRHSMAVIAAGFCSACVAIAAEAGGGAVKSEVIEYKADGVNLRGYLAYPDGPAARRPGIIVFHEWTGLNAYAKRRADELAALGYVALAADMYGDGKTTTNSTEAAALAGALRNGDRAEMRKRAAAALETLKKSDRVDPKQLAAMGYCFGGTVALELARSGADLSGIVSFHGGLDTQRPAKAGDIKGAVLICHGADDPYAPKAAVDAIQEEMRNAKADWQMIFYGNSVHAFTNPDTGNDNSKGAAYNEKADRRSWEVMRSFFEERFGEVGKTTKP